MFSAICVSAFAQPKQVNQAIVNTTMTITAPDDEDVRNVQQDQRGGMNFRQMFDGETEIQTYYKDQMSKTVVNTQMGRSTIIRDNNKKLTTTLMEMMGNKMGFYTTDDEQAEMQKKRDSIMNERRKSDTSQNRYINIDRNNVQVQVIKLGENKKIAGYVCEKAFMLSSYIPGRWDTTIVWYTPEFKIQNMKNTANFDNMPGMGMMSFAMKNIDKIDGFVMSYQMKFRGNRTMTMEVSKIVLDKQIDDKEFKIPSDFELKPMKEMRGMFGGERGMMRPPAGRD